MKDFKNKKPYTNEDYVKYINSILDKDYEMFTKESIVTVFDEQNSELTQEVSENVIKHKTCGHIFWMKHEQLISKIKKGLVLCPYCNRAEIKKEV